MKLGLVGLPGSGKKTVFEALTQSPSTPGHHGENRIATISVPDERVDVLTGMYAPRKTIYAQVEYFLPGVTESSREQQSWSPIRDCDALIHIIRNYSLFGMENPTPRQDFHKIDQDLILSDLVVAEKRIERLELDQKRGKQIDPEELSLLKECHRSLESEVPLRAHTHLSTAPVLRGFAFVSAKPQLVLFNNADEDDALPTGMPVDMNADTMIIRGKLEQELSQMTAAERSEFLAEYNIQDSATDRVIRKSYELLGLISFFTVGEDEVRAWTIRRNTPAVDAAEVIHSDIKKGFIRAEVVSYADLTDAGSHQEAKKRGTARLEGKTYDVQDGDIINFRFNV